MIRELVIYNGEENYHIRLTPETDMERTILQGREQHYIRIRLIDEKARIALREGHRLDWKEFYRLTFENSFWTYSKLPLVTRETPETWFVLLDTYATLREDHVWEKGNKREFTEEEYYLYFIHTCLSGLLPEINTIEDKFAYMCSEFRKEKIDKVLGV